MKTSLVLETHNLEGGSGDVGSGLVRVLTRLAAQTRPLTDVVVTYRGLSPETRAMCDRVAGVQVTWLAVADDVSYYEAKNRGFAAATGDIMVFADADCWPDLTWYEELTEPFRDPAVDVVAGRTTYRRDLVGTAATTIDFMYFETVPGFTRNFYANNVAFRRATFAAHPYRAHSMYRGHCTALGFELHAANIPIRFAPAARTIHRLPDSARELLQLRLLRGRDTYKIAPALVESVTSRSLPRGGPLLPLAVLAGRLGFSMRSLNHQDMPPARGRRRLGAMAAIIAFSAVDAVGAVAGVVWRSAPSTTLSYHGDADRLA